QRVEPEPRAVVAMALWIVERDGALEHRPRGGVVSVDEQREPVQHRRGGGEPWIARTLGERHQLLGYGARGRPVARHVVVGEQEPQRRYAVLAVGLEL